MGGGWWVVDGGWWVVDGGWWVVNKYQAAALSPLDRMPTHFNRPVSSGRLLLTALFFCFVFTHIFFPPSGQAVVTWSQVSFFIFLFFYPPADGEK